MKNNKSIGILQHINIFINIDKHQYIFVGTSNFPLESSKGMVGTYVSVKYYRTVVLLHKFRVYLFDLA